GAGVVREPVQAAVAGGGSGRDEARRGPDRRPGGRAGQEPAHGGCRGGGRGDQGDGPGRRARAPLAQRTPGREGGRGPGPPREHRDASLTWAGEHETSSGGGRGSPPAGAARRRLW